MRFSELEGLRIGAWGLGRETIALSEAIDRHLDHATLAVVATDRSISAQEQASLGAAAPVFAHGADIVPALEDCDVVVRSPGVSIYRPEIGHLIATGTPVTSGTALWLAEVGGRDVIGVTGTKGKSTTASLTAHLLRAAGRSVHLAGNVGVPVLALLDQPPADHYVIELSSYQIADLTAGPEIAVFTNLYREHIDWHGSEAAYQADKLRLAGLPNVVTVIAGAEDPSLLDRLELLADDVRTFGDAAGFHLDDRSVLFGDRHVMSLADLPMPGRHNGLNLCAALTALAAVGVAAPLPESLADFRLLPHRLEQVAGPPDVTWVNDSISTTPESALAALASYPDQRIILIAGGHDRQQDYATLGAEIARRSGRGRGRPETGNRVVSAARAAGVADTDAVEVSGLEEAVEIAFARAGVGDVVLLSPAAPSFGAYADFEQRGAHFRALVAAQLRPPRELSPKT
jgi:UDP-N-acetylmuramoylalanine--D-glutamate ligase